MAPPKLAVAVSRAFRRGQIKSYLETHTVAQTVRHYKASPNTVKAVKLNKTRRTDMDAYRKKKSKKKAKANERRRHIGRLLQQTIVQTASAPTRKKKTKLDGKSKPKLRERDKRILPKYPTCKSIQNWFRENRKDEAIPSISTIRRDAIELNFKNYVRPKVPYKQLQKKLREKFCKKEDFQRRAYVKNIHFSDEHIVTSNDNTSRTQWVKITSLGRKGALPRSATKKFNAVNSMFWSMIGYNYKSPIIWIDFPNQKDPTKQVFSLDAYRYRTYILENKNVKKQLLKKNTIFMQDGATSHTARDTLVWFKHRRIKVLENWPANSPDLNPIEEVWAEVNRRIALKDLPGTRERLREMVEEVWEEYPMSKINNHVMSFINKTRNCAKNKGGFSY